MLIVPSAQQQIKSPSITEGNLTLIVGVLPDVKHLLQSHIKWKKNRISCWLWKSSPGNCLNFLQCERTSQVMSKSKNKGRHRKGVTALSFHFISYNLSHIGTSCIEENAAFRQKTMEIK